MIVLQIIGIILKILLFIFLALVLYVLFSPFTYSVDIKLLEKSRIVFRLGDVLRLFSVRFVREAENRLTIEFLFGLIKLRPKKKKNDEEEKEEEKSEEEKKKEKEKKSCREEREEQKAQKSI